MRHAAAAVVLQFHDVRSLAVAEDGTIFIGNNQTATIRVFTRTGEVVREFGRRGRGPGEYTAVNRVWLAGNDIAITDWRSGRIGLHAQSGEQLQLWTSVRPDGSRVTRRRASGYARSRASTPPCRSVLATLRD